MANTRKNLAEIGRKALNNEDQLVELGRKTIRDVVQKALADSGIENAVGFELKLVNGETISITSDNNPNLSRPAAEVSSVQVKQSARAGADYEVFTVIRWAN